MKYKILLIKPYVYTVNLGIEIPLGILYLSSYLKKYLGEQVNVKIFDMRTEKNRVEALIEQLESFKPDLIGLSLLTFEHNFFSDHKKYFNTHAPNAKIIMGGPYASSNYHDILKKDKVLCAVIGEGEKTLNTLAKKLIKNQNIYNIKGIAYNKNNSIIYNEGNDYIEDLDSIPFPDYSDIDISKYWGNRYIMNGLLAEKRHVHVMSSRACPYRCIYCHNMFGKKFRTRSPENFIDEIKMYYDKFGVREFHIIDDVFNFHRKRMRAILNGIIESNMKIKIAFPNAVRGDLLNEEDIDLLKKAGAYNITFAIETTSMRLQKIINKNLDVEAVRKNIEYASKIGILTRGYFMLGFPTETPGEILNTIQFALDSKLNLANIFAVVPFPGTGLAKLAEETYDKLKGKTYATFSAESFYYEEMTGFKLRKAITKAYLKFYSPKRLAILLWKVPRKIFFIKLFLSSSLGVLKGSLKGYK